MINTVNDKPGKIKQGKWQSLPLPHHHHHEDNLPLHHTLTPFFNFPDSLPSQGSNYLSNQNLLTPSLKKKYGEGGTSYG